MQTLQYKSNTSERTKEKVISILQKPSQGRTNGACVQINGEWSCGKSLFLGFIALERNVNAEGLPIITNLKLKGVGEYTRLTDNIDVIRKARNSLIMIDEIRRYMDSYLTQSRKTRFISNITADFGKFSNDFYYTDQSATAAPARVRNNISLVVYPKLDESTNWVNVYLFYGVQEYIWVQPFFNFAFYGPDYWWVYETEQKVEDFKLQFPVRRYSAMFLLWKRKYGISAASRRTINLWNLETGESLSSSEQDAILTHIEEKGYD